MATFTTVGELIQALHEVNPNLPVNVSSWDYEAGRWVDHEACEVIPEKDKITIY